MDAVTASPNRIRTLLIANRGEIAVRIIRSARAMGIRTAVVFSDADADSLAVQLSDSAIRIGPAPARDSYLSTEAVIAAAGAAKADAIHPGYGFLAENADFADSCAKAGLIFVGPCGDTIRAMGDKARARARMAAAGVPVLPGYEGEDQTPAVLAQAAKAIGYPVLIKPSAGGGGKGMHVVECTEDFMANLQAAQREASSAFGDSRVILERYLETARHIEVQIFADRFGETVHLFDRDCSVQRRHQKLIEEAPAPDLPDALREGLHQAAITCARSVDYVGAGTVEFLVAEGHFFFMEMNTRLQVEHPVTEAITGFDLVEWQLRVAAGEHLPTSQKSIACTGHAIEARLCAEDPAAGFLPSTGRIHRLALPDGPDLRVDTGVRAGDSVSPHYDSLLAKIIARGADRDEALARLDTALAATEVIGPATNRELLMAIIEHRTFADGGVDTRFIEHNHAELLAPPLPPDDSVIATAAFIALRWLERSGQAFVDSADPFSPWLQTSGWRLGGAASGRLELGYADNRIVVGVAWRRDGYELHFADRRWTVSGVAEADGGATIRLNDTIVKARGVLVGETLHLFMNNKAYAFALLDPRRPASTQISVAGRIVSPMPGLVLSVTAAAGTAVEKGQPLVVIEAMKMEHTVAAPRAGRVQSVDVRVGDQVVAGAELVVLEAEA
jgi:3-methylcrotonyl-CoA carboxylase alpha subunit